jgi:hypothetical protein
MEDLMLHTYNLGTYGRVWILEEVPNLALDPAPRPLWEDLHLGVLLNVHGVPIQVILQQHKFIRLQNHSYWRRSTEIPICFGNLLK